MEISFNCSACQQALEIDGSAAGTEVECPNCHNPLTVPIPPATRKISLRRSAPVAPPPVPLPVTAPVEASCLPGGPAEFQCVNPDCGVMFSAAQLLTLQLGTKSVKVCPKCQMPARELRSLQSFWAHLGSCFAYPFRGNGA